MHNILKWVKEARPDKELGPAMTYYLVRDGEIRATDGKLTVGHPWPNDEDAFLVSGAEFEKVLARMDKDEPTVTYDLEASSVIVRSGRFHATIATLAVDSWEYVGVEDETWSPIPEGFTEALKRLRAFIADNSTHPWAGCVGLEKGNMYATNMYAVAGCTCDVGDVRALLSAQGVDFILRRLEGLEHWACNDNHLAFRWSSGAWMRIQQVIGRFNERAIGMVEEVRGAQPTQEITDKFREAFADVAGLAEDTVRIYEDRIESQFKRSKVVAATDGCEVPPDTTVNYIDDKGKAKKRTRKGGVSVWAASILAPVISQATHWSPATWPERAPFKGDNMAGFILGRKEA